MWKCDTNTQTHTHTGEHAINKFQYLAMHQLKTYGWKINDLKMNGCATKTRMTLMSIINQINKQIDLGSTHNIPVIGGIRTFILKPQLTRRSFC